MTPRPIPCFFAILVLTITLMAGCAQEEPVVAPPTPTPTPTPSPTPTPAPTLSPACSDLQSAAGADVAFLNALADNIISARIHSLAYRNCARAPAAEISKNLADSPRPGTPVLASARGSLLSAAGYCFEPEEGTAVSRTKDDLNSYIGKMGEYCALVHGCMDSIDRNASFPLQNAVEDQGCILISGTGSKAQYLPVENEGKKAFIMSYDGPDPFSVSLTDLHGKKTLLAGNTAGAFHGVKSEDLKQGNYKIEIAAGGPWTVSIFNP